MGLPLKYMQVFTAVEYGENLVEYEDSNRIKMYILASMYCICDGVHFGLMCWCMVALLIVGKCGVINFCVDGDNW